MRGTSGSGAYGDFIQDLDHSVGTILRALDARGMSENTIVIFTSDNGGQFDVNEKDSAEAFAMNKGLKLNGDLRGDKHTIYEGGTRVPFIVKWPGKVTPGSVSNELVNLVDVFATLNEIVANDRSISENSGVDSYSFLGALLQQEVSNSRETMVTADVRGMHAIRSQNWKYIDDTPPEGLPGEVLARLKMSFKPQLYDLKKDPGETQNLYESKPEVVEKLKKELNSLRKTASRL
jgi:arylsulfatase A-like enzyme